MGLEQRHLISITPVTWDLETNTGKQPQAKPSSTVEAALFTSQLLSGDLRPVIPKSRTCSPGKVLSMDRIGRCVR